MNKFGYLKAYKVKVLPIKYLITKGEITHQDNEKETSLDEKLNEIYQQPNVIPEGLEVIKFEVPKLFEQHVLSKLRESGKEVRVKIELPESFKNSTCLYVAEGSYPKLIDVGQEYSEATGEKVRHCTLIRLTSTSNVKSTNATPIIDDNYALAQKIAESKVNEGLFVKWLAKYVTETYLADKQKENQYLYVRNDP